MSLSTLKVYREALRATRIAFHNDITVLKAARLQIKQEIKQSKNQNQSNDEIQIGLQKLKDINKFLIENLVQGEKQNNGKYLLNFHDKIELGDNETIKQNHKEKMGSLSNAKTVKLSKDAR
ncbi:unnamed protein product [Candida verbasci]|uniref:Mitochondrial zinc maintenance protein 1, mitochondrial n=1 Tax=Candida verbasci TaxID=1227364 RepID=A0A9W4TY37_9ASCO|nr:unnamed protein product [Candida verbasci]